MFQVIDIGALSGGSNTLPPLDCVIANNVANINTTGFKRARAEFEALMLSTSAPQVPAVVATMLFMMGASLTPVLVCMGVAMLGVLSLGLGGREPDEASPPATPAPRTPAAP